MGTKRIDKRTGHHGSPSIRPLKGYSCEPNHTVINAEIKKLSPDARESLMRISSEDPQIILSHIVDQFPKGPSVAERDWQKAEYARRQSDLARSTPRRTQSKPSKLENC
jgi:hypothetical protein